MCCVRGVCALFRVWNEEVLNARVEKLTTSGHVKDIFLIDVVHNEQNRVYVTVPQVSPVCSGSV